jgi:lysophospholipase L1-like esterase
MTSNQLSIMLIGDSITEGFNTSLLPQFRITNRGVSGDSTVEALERINPDWFNEKPDMIFICIGTNDIARGRTDEFIIQAVKQLLIK